ncbi:rRNA large subunit pseudouridine synthase E [Leptolyngbya ohadii]|uniref:rRNA large subunit pseudouridine synthase E n=1 Tax=Leptolyngbya ohadii TaxID=1962290 RepID=UPI0034E2E3B5
MPDRSTPSRRSSNVARSPAGSSSRSSRYLSRSKSVPSHQQQGSSQNNRYILFFKPFDVLTQFTDESEDDRRTLKDYIPVPDVYPVGRLDRDSEGLLLLTNDGGIQHQLTDPKFAHPRTYWVQVERIPDEAALQKLRSGIQIQDYRTRPAKVKLLESEPDLPSRDPPIRFRKTVPTAWIEITLTEGKNRQVRRMTAAVGFPTLRLVRVAIGQLKLQGLQPGEWRDLTPQELQLAFRR